MNLGIARSILFKTVIKGSFNVCNFSAHPLTVIGYFLIIINLESIEIFCPFSNFFFRLPQASPFLGHAITFFSPASKLCAFPGLEGLRFVAGLHSPCSLAR